MATITPSPAVRFILPARAFALAQHGGIEIDVQLWIARHQDNRRFRLEWDGPGCGGGTERDLAGAEAPATQPDEPLTVRLHEGTCTFTALVYGPGDAVRARATLDMQVCGSVAECGA